MDRPTLIGRSSSSFTRVARIFAIELGVAHDFRPVLDLTSHDEASYGGNPALKIPVWLDEHGPLFGSENICRAVAGQSGRTNVVLRGDVHARVVANAEELVLHSMTAEVTLIMTKMAGEGAPLPPKVVAGLAGSLAWLDANLEAIAAGLPNDRLVSFVEVALFCLVTHLPFRKVMDVSQWKHLDAFRACFAERAGPRSTEYRFDAAS